MEDSEDGSDGGDLCSTNRGLTVCSAASFCCKSMREASLNPVVE